MLYPIQRYLFNWYIIQKCISNTHIYLANWHIPKLYIPTTMCQNGTRKLSKVPSSPKNWHVISNTNLYTQPKHIPNMYIPTKMCQDGTRKPSKLHSSPKCLHDIFNTKLYTQLTYIPKLYIPTTMCQNGTGKPSKLPSSPKSCIIYPLQSYILNWHIFQKCTFPQPCARMAQWNPPNYIHLPSVCMI